MFEIAAVHSRDDIGDKVSSALLLLLSSIYIYIYSTCSRRAIIKLVVSVVQVVTMDDFVLPRSPASASYRLETFSPDGAWNSFQHFNALDFFAFSFYSS